MSRRPYRSRIARSVRANREAIRRRPASGSRRTVTPDNRRLHRADGGVSEDLVYVLFTNKRRLLVEVLNFSVTGELDNPRVLEQQGPRPSATRRTSDARWMFAADIARRTDRARPIDDVMRSAALVDQSVAEKHREMHATRLANLTQFVQWSPPMAPARRHSFADEAAATVWALTGPDVHRLLIDDLGWDLERYATWVRRTSRTPSCLHERGA